MGRAKLERDAMVEAGEAILRAPSIEYPPEIMGVLAAFGAKFRGKAEELMLASAKESAAQILNARRRAKRAKERA